MASETQIDHRKVVGQWKDLLCQEEIGAATKLSQLCKAGKHISAASEAWATLDLDAADGENRLSARNKHIQNKDILELSAHRGCRLCHLLLARIKRESETKYLTFKGGPCYQFELAYGDLQIDSPYDCDINQVLIFYRIPRVKGCISVSSQS